MAPARGGAGSQRRRPRSRAGCARRTTRGIGPGWAGQRDGLRPDLLCSTSRCSPSVRSAWRLAEAGSITCGWMNSRTPTPTVSVSERLASEHANLCVVGGRRPGITAGVEPMCETGCRSSRISRGHARIKLEQNYRSTGDPTMRRRTVVIAAPRKKSPRWARRCSQSKQGAGSQ